MNMVIYTNRGIPKEWAAVSRFPFILIRPKWKGVAYILEHEKVHHKQVLRTWFTHGLRYKFSKGYRLRAEVEAYKVGIANGQTLKDAAWALSTGYDLDMTIGEAAILLTQNV